MSEKKKGLGTLTVEETGRKLEFVSVLAGCFAGNRRVFVSKTETGTYAIGIERAGEDGLKTTGNMHLTRESFSALLSAIHLFLEKEKEDVAVFSQLAFDEESGFLYKTLDDLKEDAE